jgi:hypothetical protein
MHEASEFMAGSTWHWNEWRDVTFARGGAVVFERTVRSPPPLRLAFCFPAQCRMLSVSVPPRELWQFKPTTERSIGGVA